MIRACEMRRTIPVAILLALVSCNSVLAQETGQAEAGMAPDTVESGETAEQTTEIVESEAVKGRFLPAPFVITEPAIGKGLGVGMIYFHGKDAVERPRISSATAVGRTARSGKPPPTATAAGGFYTDNETAGLALAHSRSMLDDKYRVVGLLASMDIHATFYQDNSGFDFGLDAEAVYGRVQRRMGDSDMFLGMSFGWLDGTINFDLPVANLPGSILASDFTDAGIAASAIHDSRDDTMMPGSGHLYDLTIWRHDDALGSDFNYTNTRIKALSFHKLSDNFHLGLRLDVATSNGDAPFFAVPYVPLRGIPAMRFQGDTAGAVEIEGRYNIKPRWAAIAFAGAGFIDWDDSTKVTENDIYSAGVGFRWQLFVEQNVWIGMDIAKGPEESNWYIQIGHPW